MNMKWLLWKDYRQNRPIVVMVLFFLVMPHLVALCGACWMTFHESQGRSPWELCFGASSLVSILVSQLLMAIVGGNAFAGERVDRSAEFLGALPIRRSRIIFSKLLFALTIVTAIWLVNLPGLAPIAVDALRSQREASEIVQIVLGAAITGMAFFCIAWLFSSVLTSPTFAVFGGLVGTYLLGIVSLLICYLLGLDVEYRPLHLHLIYCGLCLVTSPVCFALGTWHYLRRVEP